MTTPQQPDKTPASITEHGVSEIAARLDRLPVQLRHWQLVLLGQFMLGTVLIVDTLVSRIYPVVWEPHQAFSQTQYSILAGTATGFGPLIGAVVFGFLADRYGRKPILMISCAVCALTIWPIGVTESWPILMICVLVSALGIGGGLAVVPSYNSE